MHACSGQCSYAALLPRLPRCWSDAASVHLAKKTESRPSTTALATSNTRPAAASAVRWKRFATKSLPEKPLGSLPGEGTRPLPAESVTSPGVAHGRGTARERTATVHVPWPVAAILLAPAARGPRTPVRTVLQAHIAVLSSAGLSVVPMGHHGHLGNLCARTVLRAS